MIVVMDTVEEKIEGYKRQIKMFQERIRAHRERILELQKQKKLETVEEQKKLETVEDSP